MKPIPRKAFTDVSGFEAKKHAIRQTTEGVWQITFTVAEFGNADWLVFAPTGLPLAIGLKALDYDNPEPEEESPYKKYITKSVMLCKDERFQKFMGATNESECADALKKHLKITSRSELGEEGPPASKLRMNIDRLIDSFKSSLLQRTK
tara:strand:+ start:2823 stop:3269 length:447 start_codon:yes stop_codon:yes gene_type:complete